MSCLKLVSWPVLRAHFLRGFWLALVAVAALSANGAHAALVIAPPNPTSPRTNAGSDTIGWEFNVGASSITIDALGAEDDNASGGGFGGGLSAAHTVDIWNVSSGSVVATVSVPAGTAGTLINGFRYAILNSPVTLQANTYYYIGNFADAHGFYDFTDGSGTSSTSGLFVPGPGITFDSCTYYAGGSLTGPHEPTTTSAGPFHWANANATEILTWTGTQNNQWSTAAATNWSGGTAAAYTEGSSVIFDDTATGATNIGISTANVSPGAVFFNNSALSYTLTGTYGISGAATVAKTGTGLVTISNSNAFTGATTISAGTLQLGNASALMNSTVGVGASNGLSFLLGTTATTLGGLSGSGSFALLDGASNPVTLTVGNNGASTVYSGTMSGAGGGLVLCQSQKLGLA